MLDTWDHMELEVIIRWGIDLRISFMFRGGLRLLGRLLSMQPF